MLIEERMALAAMDVRLALSIVNVGVEEQSNERIPKSAVLNRAEAVCCEKRDIFLHCDESEISIHTFD